MKPGTIQRLASRTAAVYPFARGRTRMRKLLAGSLVAEPFPGVWMRVSGVADFEWALLGEQRAKEPISERVLRSYLRPGMTFVDVGANIGYFSLLAASLVGKQGTVVAYEPTPEVAARLRENAALNGLEIRIREGAVADNEGRLTFFRGQSDSEGNSLYPDDTGAASFSVAAFTLDADVGRLGLGSLDLLKIDAEGAEPRVLCGARQTIRRFRPLIVVEGNQRKLTEGGSSIAGLRSQLRELGYATETLECMASPDWGVTVNLLAYPDPQAAALAG